MSTQPMDLFWDACAAEAPFQLAVRHRRDPRAVIHVLQQPFAVVGRDEKNDLVLDSEQLSKRHVYLQVVAGRIYCVDMQSRTGIHWSTGSQPAGWLSFNDVLRIGPYSIRPLPHAPDPQQPARAASFAEPPPLPTVSLDFALDGSHKGSWKMKGLVVLVGGAPECGVQLLDPSISRHHCSLVRTCKGVWVIELLGRGGICVNGFAVRCARLKDGDELQIGRVMVRFRQDEELDLPVGRPLNRALSLPGLPALSGHRNGSSLPSNSMVLAAPSSASATGLSASALVSALPAQPAVKLLPESMAGDLSNASLIPLVNQFSTLHQQMFDQFQQATLMMVQMFTSLQGEQLGLIREELERLHKLTDELQHLHTEAQRHPKPAPGQAVAQVAATVSGPARPFKADAVGRTRTNGTAEGKRPVKGPGRPPAASAPRGSPPKSPANSTASKSPAPELPEANMHAWITQRIAAIQEEQQSSWQRILQFVVGRRAEDPVL